MMTASIDTSKFNANLARYVDELAMSGPKVVADQTRLLLQTLVRISPPLDRKKSEDALQKKVEATFGVFDKDTFQKGSGDVQWLFSTPEYLIGTRAGSDMRKAGDKELEKLLGDSRAGKRGVSVKVDFKSRRGNQRVKIYGRLLLKKAQRARLVRNMKARFGRLKAAWAVGMQNPLVGGLDKVPQWIRRHVGPRTKGTTIDGLGIPKFPQFTIINSAAGIGKTAGIVNSALRIRAKAMAKDVELYLNGTKKKAGFA